VSFSSAGPAMRAARRGTCPIAPGRDRRPDWALTAPGGAGADNSMPLFAFVFLVALGIDYNIFLMTRVREESIRAGTRRGMLTGLAATGGVITAAGLVLAGTFATLATLPLVILTEIGFTVALGVLLDTLVVRSVLVTALTLDIGRHIWWPSRLAARRDDDAAAEPSEQLSRAR
jgi:putative drug exporter of the RND superfamily